MRTVIFAAAVALAFNTAAMPGSDGPFTNNHWTGGQYAQQVNDPVMVFPNPATDRVNLTYPGLTGEATVSIIAEDGRLLRRINIGETHAVRSVLPIGDLRNGIYFIRVVQPSGLDLMKRLVVVN